MPPPAKTGINIISIGYDRRLKLWSLEDENGGKQEELNITFLCGSMCNIGDIGSMHCAHSSVLVVGEGFQLFNLENIDSGV